MSYLHFLLLGVKSAIPDTKKPNRMKPDIKKRQTPPSCLLKNATSMALIGSLPFCMKQCIWFYLPRL
jgi:hypothetical protein